MLHSYVNNLFDKTGKDIVAGPYNVTITPGTTQATVDIPLILDDDDDEETEYFMVHLYIPSASYELGIRQGSILNAIASIISPGTYHC